MKMKIMKNPAVVYELGPRYKRTQISVNQVRMLLVFDILTLHLVQNFISELNHRIVSEPRLIHTIKVVINGTGKCIKINGMNESISMIFDVRI
jgi:hypothetical protein